MGISLRAIGLAMLLLPVALFTAVVVTAIVRVAEASLEDRLQGEIELIARAVAPLVSRHLDEGDASLLREALRGIFDIGRVYGAAVYDARGNLIARSGRADSEVQTEADAPSTLEGGSYRQVGQEDVYTFFTPLSGQGGRINGLLQVNRERAEIDAALGRLRVGSWVAWGVTVLLLALLLFSVYRRLIEWPLHRLLGAMDAVAGGNRSTRIALRQPREFAGLAASFNTMIEAVDRAEAEREASRERELTLQGRLRETEKIAAIGRVAAGIAHELGAPLSVIAGRSARIRRRYGDAESRYDLEQIDQETWRLKAIVEQLLEYCRGSVREHRTLDMRVVVSSAVRVVDEEVGGAPECVWVPPPAEFRVDGDRVRLEIAVTNLLRNAMRHASSQVRVSLRADAGRALLRVADDGPGVGAEDAGRLFEPFFTRQVSGRGTGLGLAIVASVAFEHAGEAGYAGRDETLGGAAFEFGLPLALPQADVQETREQRHD